jgi:hypothetical protein
MPMPPDGPGPGLQPEGPAVGRARHWLGAFGHFWWDFLIGDTPELFVGAVLALVAVALLAHNGVTRAVTVGSLPVLVTALLVASVRRARRAKPSEGGGGAAESRGASATE